MIVSGINSNLQTLLNGLASQLSGGTGNAPLPGCRDRNHVIPATPPTVERGGPSKPGHWPHFLLLADRHEHRVLTKPDQQQRQDHRDTSVSVEFDANSEIRRRTNHQQLDRVLEHEVNHALDNSDLQSNISSLNSGLATSISGWDSATNGPQDQTSYVSAYQSLQLQNEATATIQVRNAVVSAAVRLMCIALIAVIHAFLPFEVGAPRWSTRELCAFLQRLGQRLQLRSRQLVWYHQTFGTLPDRQAMFSYASPQRIIGWHEITACLNREGHVYVEAVC
jgi:hypothetical protein